jgi:hypothetical protein
VRDAAAKILENTTLADLIGREPEADSHPKAINRKTARKKKSEPGVAPVLAAGEVHD